MMWPFSKSAPVLAAPPEQKASGTAVPDDWLLELFGAGVVGSVAVSASVALQVPAVAAAVRVISEAAATLDVKILRGTDEVEHPAGELLRADANDWTSGFEMIRDLTAQALTTDAGGLAWVNRSGGQPVEIIRYDPGTISVQYATTGEPTYRLNGREIDARDVVHVRGPFAKCPLTLARTAIGVAHVMEAHAASLWQNGARPGGVIEFPGKMGDEGLKKMKAGWRAAHEGASQAGKTALLWEGAKFNALTMNSTDAQFLENRKFQNLEIARAFRIPPSMIFELDRVTWSNGEQMGKEFLTYCLEPWLRALEGALSRALFTPEERRTLRIVFERDDLTRASLTERATAYSSLITARVLNPNEARAWEGLPPYAAGDVYANPAVTPGPANSNTPPPPQEDAA